MIVTEDSENLVRRYRSIKDRLETKTMYKIQEYHYYQDQHLSIQIIQ